jgi:putative FmdB family regulatory protein
MPLYEYECDACGERFEVIQKFSETSTECRRCGKGPVRRLMSSPAIQFKGTGWYVTDYAQKGKSGGEPGSAGSAAKSDSSETKKTDTASPDSKADSKKTESTPAATTASKD